MPPKYDYTGVEDPSIIEERIVMPSTLETIDESFFEYVDQNLNIFSTTKWIYYSSSYNCGEDIYDKGS